MSSERQPPGVPIGGQWAPTQHAEGEVDLPSVTDTERRWAAAQDHFDRHWVVERDEIDPTDAKRYLLLDSDRSGEAHASFWDDIEAAEDYQTEQESAEDWTPEIVDLDTGDVWDSWYQARTAVAAATPTPEYPEHDTFTFEDGVTVDASFTVASE